MNIFEVFKCLYTSRDLNWLSQVDENEIQPYIIQRWLVSDNRISASCRFLDKYIFFLPPKMYLSLVWSLIPKTGKTPFLKYTGKKEVEDDMDFIYKRLRKHLELSDNDFRANKRFFDDSIKEMMQEWFMFYGVEKNMWKKYNLDFDTAMKFKEAHKDDKKEKGLSEFGF